MIKWVIYTGPSLYDEDEPPIEVYLTPEILGALLDYDHAAWSGFLQHVDMEKRLREYS